jgi:hypothetical protein
VGAARCRRSADWAHMGNGSSLLPLSAVAMDGAYHGKGLATARRDMGEAARRRNGEPSPHNRDDYGGGDMEIVGRGTGRRTECGSAVSFLFFVGSFISIIFRVCGATAFVPRGVRGEVGRTNHLTTSSHFI